MRLIDALLGRPRLLGALCAVGATGLGFVYLAVAGAPVRDLVVNGVALALGFATLGLILLNARPLHAGLVNLLLGCVLLLGSLFGATMDGATRWIALGGLVVQPSFLILPVMTLGFARSRDRMSMLGILLAALALALEPDRAMAGALAAGLMALALLRKERNSIIALAGALAGFGVTLLRPDTLQAMPYVEQIYSSSFALHPLAGIAVMSGAALMLLPVMPGLFSDADHRALYAVFGLLWLAVLAAAALGNYPTPLVGYGGSAIVGYVISLIGLPARTYRLSARAGDGSPPTDDADDRTVRMSYS